MKQAGKKVVFVLMASFLMCQAVNASVAQKLSVTCMAVPFGIADCFQIFSSKVGLFTLGGNVFFRDRFGNIGQAREMNFEKRMYASSFLRLRYEILWENGSRTKHVSGRYFPNWSTANIAASKDLEAIGFQDFKGLEESRMNIIMPLLADGDPYYTSFSTAKY